MKKKRFPEIATILSDEIKTFAIDKSRRKAVAKIAVGLGLSADTVDSWRRGTRSVPEEKIESLVRILGYVDSNQHLTAEGTDLVCALQSARKKSELLLSWRERVEEGTITLRVREARYEGAGRLWGRIFDPFLNAADVQHSGDDRKRTFFELQRDVWDGSLDIALGILATPQLSLKLWFYNSPINYGLNAVALKSEIATHGGITRVRHAMSNRKRRRETVLPVVMKGEVGEIYARRHLGFTSQIQVGAFDASLFCNALQAREKGLSRNAAEDDRIRVAIVDEVTCFSILIKLRGRGQLILPLVPDPGDRRAIIPPTFPLGICISRNEQFGHAKNSELQAFLRDALTQHIYGNARSIAYFYVALRDRIRRMVDRAVPESPREERDEWVARAFRLNDCIESWREEPACWRAVLREGMRLIR